MLLNYRYHQVIICIYTLHFLIHGENIMSSNNNQCKCRNKMSTSGKPLNQTDREVRQLHNVRCVFEVYDAELYIPQGICTQEESG